jgi:hypothetical protein
LLRAKWRCVARVRACDAERGQAGPARPSKPARPGPASRRGAGPAAPQTPQTRAWGVPRGAGGMPLRSNWPSLWLSLVMARSPSNTFCFGGWGGGARVRVSEGRIARGAWWRAGQPLEASRPVSSSAARRRRRPKDACRKQTRLDRHGRLLVLVGGEDLALLGGDHRVARDQLGHHAADGLDAQRQRGDVEQQDVLHLVAALAAQDAALWFGRCVCVCECVSASVCAPRWEATGGGGVQTACLAFPTCIGPATPHSGARAGRRRAWTAAP